MKEFILITTEGYTIAPNEDIEIENCQVLGIVKAEDETSSIDILFRENPWICDAGFTREKIISKPLLTEESINAIKAVVDYPWLDEQKHCEEWDYPSNHIFRVLEKLKALIQ